jgi:hypothetical protein
MLHRVKLVGKGASIRRGRVVVGGEGVLGVSVLIPSLLSGSLLWGDGQIILVSPLLGKCFAATNRYWENASPQRQRDAIIIFF